MLSASEILTCKQLMEFRAAPGGASSADAPEIDLRQPQVIIAR
jgi:hypothetical protein